MRTTFLILALSQLLLISCRIMDLSGHFLIIGVGSVLSVLSFLGELCYNRCRPQPRSEWLGTELNIIYSIYGWQAPATLCCTAV